MVECGKESVDVSVYMEEGKFDDVPCENVVSCNSNNIAEINTEDSSFYSSTSIYDSIDNLDINLPSTPTSHDRMFVDEQCGKCPEERDPILRLEGGVPTKLLGACVVWENAPRKGTLSFV